MGVKERKARQKKFLRQEILDAASELFVKDGFENVSMRRIADKIEYSPTTIYLYFKDKAGLLEQVCQETFARLSLVLARIQGLPGDPVERLNREINAGLAVRSEAHDFPFVAVGNEAKKSSELRVKEAERIGPVEREDVIETPGVADAMG